MKTLYIVSENQTIDNRYADFVEIKRFLSREIAERYIEKHQRLREENVYQVGEYLMPETIGQMIITQFPICETLEEAEECTDTSE